MHTGENDGRDKNLVAVSDEKPQHRVKITNPFHLSAFEVTQQQYQEVMGVRPWLGKPNCREGPEYPTTYVSWQDAVAFCRRLSELERAEYRLPTEAEWEFIVTPLKKWYWRLMMDNYDQTVFRYSHGRLFVERKATMCTGLGSTVSLFQSLLIVMGVAVFCCRGVWAGEPMGGGAVRLSVKGAPRDNQGARTVRFEVREIAGIRRRSDVVSARFALAAPVPPETRFRVLHDAKPIASQIRRIKDRSGRIESITIDFIDNFGPLQIREYQLEYGLRAAATAAPNTGFELRETDQAYHISNRGRIEWTVRKDLKGMFRFRRNPDVEYVGKESAGLVFRTRDGVRHRLADQKPTMARVTRNGPIACGLEFRFADWPKGAMSQVELEFVRTKSWVRATWTINGGRDVTGLGAELRLALEGREKLIDFGADDFVYTTVRAGEIAALEAGPTENPEHRKTRWVVLHGKAGSLQPQVLARPDQPASGVAGWAHVMDESRCTAIAIGDFGRHTRDRLEVASDGRLLTSREFGRDLRAAQTKTFEFWVHFVGMPVHIGARTSPQAMRSPLQVRWLDKPIRGRQSRQ